MKIPINYLDLFSGTGGFAKGLLAAGFVFAQHYFSEIDTHAIASYKANFKQAHYIGDIIKVKAKNLKNIDLISFGSPCQDISIAGNGEGLKGNRSGLFFEALRLINECKPRAFIFENVKGLLFSNKGRDFETVIKAFADIGLYNIQWQLLNTAWFLPQNRERIYLVGTHREKPAPQIFPIGKGYTGRLAFPVKTAGEKALTPTIDTKIGDSTHRSPYVLHWKNSQRGWAVEAMKQSPTLHTQNDWIRVPLVFSRGALSGAKQISIDTVIKILKQKKASLRKFTPVECERLQGFPDNWTALGNYNGIPKPISDTQRYTMLGNAVTVAVVEAVAKRLIPYFK